MGTGIRDKVAVIGMGCTRFGELWDTSEEDLIVDAFKEALADAGIEKKDIQAAWFGSAFPDVNAGSGAVPMARALKLQNIPVTRVENFCTTGTEAFRGACYAVASGACDIALALGAEKLKDTGYGGLPDFGTVMGTENLFYMPNLTAPGMFAMVATAYFEKYGLSPEQGKRILSRISYKSHKNGAMNPRAHLRKEVPIEAMLKAPVIAWPLGLFDCCGVSDGAAAAIVVRADMAKDFRPDPIYVKALQLSLTPATGILHQSWNGVHLESTRIAGIKAYEEAGITKPREEISLMEVHDCFSISELVTVESLQISPMGKGGEDFENGFYDLDGKIPCQSDGGLKCFGHPIGASGIRMLYEIYKQLQGKAEPEQRQLKGDPRIGLAHNHGGLAGSLVCSVAILGNS
ncbi:MAG: acetyl-CoA acetyltransferase [Deltaproteobacteria bacterium]|nr:acetyl-CoA acetyltransferase [Deltaproteobacteria bacterium]